MLPVFDHGIKAQEFGLVTRTRFWLVHETVSRTPKGRPDFLTLNPVLEEIIMTQERVFASDTDSEQLHYTFAGN